jgi:hypothetical protein
MGVRGSFNWIHQDIFLPEDYDIRFSGSSSLLHLGTVNDDARGDIFPKCDEQLTCQCNDCRLLAAAAVSHTLFEPAAQRGVRLMAQPQPGELDACSPQSPIASFRHPLLAID